MASPKRRRKKRAIASVLGSGSNTGFPPADDTAKAALVADMATSGLVTNAMQYMLYAAGASGKSSLVSSGSKLSAAGQVLFDKICANSGLGVSKLSDLNTRYVLKITFTEGPAAATGDWLKIGEKYFAIDNGAALADVGTLVSNYDIAAGDDPDVRVTAVKVGTSDAANNATGLAAAVKAAIEHENGFNGRVKVTADAGNLYLTWPGDSSLGAMAASQKAGAVDALPSVEAGRGGALASSAPIYFMTAATAEVTDNHGIVFFQNGPGSKYMQEVDMANANPGMTFDILPAGFDGVTKRLHLKVATSAASGDKFMIKYLSNDKGDHTALGADASGLSLETSAEISAITDLDADVAGASIALSEYVFQWADDDTHDGGIRITYTNETNVAGKAGRDMSMGGGIVVHWYVEAWA